jgi:uncharacterized protein
MSFHQEVCRQHRHLPLGATYSPLACGIRLPERSSLCAHLSLSPSDIEIVIYHAPCPDGFMAAAILFSALSPHVEYHGANHKQLPGLLSRWGSTKRILMVDISPLRSDLHLLQQPYCILDHHQSALVALQDVPVHQQVFHQDYSGCGLAWHFVYPDWDMPVLVQAIQARDLWRTSDIEQMHELLTGAHHLFGWCVHCWLQGCQPQSHATITQVGTILYRERTQRIRQYVKRAVCIPKADLRVWCVNITDMACISEVGSQILQSPQRRQDVALLFRLDLRQNLVMCSLRSREKPPGPDVSLLASRWSQHGGGHRHAAGFTWTLEEFCAFWSPSVVTLST